MSKRKNRNREVEPAKYVKTKEQQAPTNSRGWHIPLIVALSLVVYANALSGEFIWDDNIQILLNPLMRSFSFVPKAFMSAFWAWASPTVQSNYYRPFQTLFYLLVYQIAGRASPWPYHLVNIMFHALAGVFVYLICSELQLGSYVSVLAAALFAVHPVHTEAVTWIAGLPDTGCGALFMMSLWGYLRFAKSSRRKWLWFSVLGFFGALMFKEMAITLPIVVVGLMVAQKRSLQDARKAIAELIPYGIAAVIYFVMRWAALGYFSVTLNPCNCSAVDRITLGVRVLGQYVRYALVPYPLAAFHLIPIHLYDRELSTALYAAGLLLAAIGLWLARKRFPFLPFWFSLFVLMLIPVFNFSAIGGTYFAERYLYIPTLAAVIPVAQFLGLLDHRKKLALGVALVVVFGLLTIRRNEDWATSEAFYASTLKVYPEAVLFRVNLGEVLMKRGDDAGAKQQFEIAIRDAQSKVYLPPSNQAYRAYVGLGGLALREGKYDEAKKDLNEAVKLNVNEDDGVYVFLGAVAMEGDKNYPQALKYLRRAADTDPFNDTASDYLGVALFNLGRYPEALKYFEKAANVNPNNSDAIAHAEMARKAMAAAAH